MEKIKYCPRCKSTNVKINITAGAVFGSPQKWKCVNCGFESYSPFPEGDIKSKKKK